MVLAAKVGKQRPFARGLLLTVVTVGVYSLYWNYRAHNEVYRQFELHREGRDEGVLWYILGLVFAPLVFVYLWIMVGNVVYVRERLRLPRRTTPGWFVGLLVAAAAAYAIGVIVFFLTVGTIPDEATEDDALGALALGAPAFLLGLLVAVALPPVAYWRLQRDINELWSAYDARMDELRAPPVGAQGAGRGAQGEGTGEGTGGEGEREREGEG